MQATEERSRLVAPRDVLGTFTYEVVTNNGRTFVRAEASGVTRGYLVVNQWIGFLYHAIYSAPLNECLKANNVANQDLAPVFSKCIALLQKGSSAKESIFTSFLGRMAAAASYFPLSES